MIWLSKQYNNRYTKQINKIRQQIKWDDHVSKHLEMMEKIRKGKLKKLKTVKENRTYFNNPQQIVGKIHQIEISQKILNL